MVLQDKPTRISYHVSTIKKPRTVFNIHRHGIASLISKETETEFVKAGTRGCSRFPRLFSLNGSACIPEGDAVVGGLIW